jgi:hypothetical protein
MRHLVCLVSLALLVLEGIAACGGTSPPRRLPDYLGGQVVEDTTPLPPDRPIHAALIVVPDTSAPDAAPPLPDGALARLTDRFQEEVSQRLPIVIDMVIPAQEFHDRDIRSLVEVGRKRGVHYLLFVVASATEQEYPVTLFLGGITHAQPGWRRDNWSLLEAALIDVEAGRVLLRAEGRGWATLDRPSAPGINQWYPVIWLRPNDPARRYWPPTYEGAPNTLRVIAMNEAAKRWVLNLQDAWIHKRQTELQAAHSHAAPPAS